MVGALWAYHMSTVRDERIESYRTYLRCDSRASDGLYTAVERSTGRRLNCEVVDRP